MTAPGGAPLVLVPALLCDDALYRDVVERLGDEVDARVIVAPHPMAAASVADILAQAPPRFVLGGSSYGGTIAVDVALAAPERVAALWLTGCDPGAANREATLGLAGMLENATDAAVDALAGRVVRADATTAAAAFRAMAGRVGGRVGGAQARALASRPDAWSRLAALAMPALVLWGEDDAAIPVAVGERLAAALPNARLHVLAGCGHLATLEQPADVAATVGAWLRDVRA